MAKGKQTSNETLYKIMCLYAVHNNYSEVGRILNIPRKTVEKLVKEHIHDEEFTKICLQKKEEFVEAADRIINKGTNLLERRLDTALNNQDELEDLIYEIWNTNKQELNETQKKSLVQKVSKLQINGLNEIATSIGIIFDKKKTAETGIIETNTPSLNINIIDNSNFEKVMYENSDTKDTTNDK